MEERATQETLKDHVNGHVLARSTGRAWNHMLVQFLEHDSLEKSLLVPAVAEPLLVWVVSGSASVEERDLYGAWQGCEVSAGDFFLTHSKTPYEMRWRNRATEPFQVLHIYLGLSLLEAARAEVFGPRPQGFLQLREISGERDQRVSQIADMIHVELCATEESSEIYVQGLAHVLAIHLVRTYSDGDAAVPQRKGALPAFKLKCIVDIMEREMDREFRLDALAAEVELSPYHFSRAFKRSTGFSPSQYFIRLKMARARRLLRETKLSVIEIGLDLGYSSPSHFAQVFKREVGVSPSDYRV